MHPSVQVFRDVPTETVLADIECRQWDIAELACGEQPCRAAGIAFLEVIQEQAVAELERRLALRDHPLAPPFEDAHRDLRPDAREVKRAVPLSAFVERYFGQPLRRVSTIRQVGCCPLPDHNDASPSFSVYEDERWHCFGCNRGGDVFTLVQHAHGTPLFTAALAEVGSWARSTGYLPPEQN